MKREPRGAMIANLRDERGVTLAEVIIACSLTVILFTAVFGALNSSMRSLNIQNEKVEAQDMAQTTILRMERELRQAQKPFLVVVGSPGVNETLMFKADLNDDGTAEAVEYVYSGSTRQLIRVINSAGEFNFDTAPRDVMAKYVANSTSQPIFSYFGTDLTTPLDPTSPSSDIINKTRMVRVRLVIDKNGARPPAAIDMSTDIKLRNFAY